MADHIRVSLEQLEDLAAQFRKLSTALDALESDVRGVLIDRISGSEVKVQLASGALGCTGRGLGSGTASSCLRSIASALSTVDRYANTVAKNVDAAADLFYGTEKNLVWLFDGLSTTDSIFAGLCKALGYSTDRSKWSSTMLKKYRELLESAQIVTEGGLTFLVTQDKGFIFGEDGLLASFEQKKTAFSTTHTSKFYDGDSVLEGETKLGLQEAGFTYKKKIVEPEKFGDGVKSYDMNGNPVEGEGILGGKNYDLLKIGASTGATYSAWQKSGAYEDGGFTASGSVSAGNFGVEGSANFGLGVYKPDKDGNMKLNAGFGVEAGVSCSAASAQGSLEYELLDGVAIGSEGEVSLLAGEAGVQGGLGILDGKLVAYGEASAEFNVAEAKGDAYVDIGGVKGSVGGSVSVGVGAHAKAGYHDGVVSVDVGASLGVGVSVNFELDVSGALDNIGEGLQTAGDFISEGWDTFCSWWG